MNTVRYHLATKLIDVNRAVNACDLACKATVTAQSSTDKTVTKSWSEMTWIMRIVTWST